MFDWEFITDCRCEAVNCIHTWFKHASCANCAHKDESPTSVPCSKCLTPAASISGWEINEESMGECAVGIVDAIMERISKELHNCALDIDNGRFMYD